MQDLGRPTMPVRRVCALAGGVGGARFLRGLRAHLDVVHPGCELTVIGNTGDDITLGGLRICPDLDTLMYTLGGGIDEDQGWGREGDTRAVMGELLRYGAIDGWFGLGDLDFATHIARTRWLGEGLTLCEVTRRLSMRWDLAAQGVTLLPMTDVPVETEVVVDEPEGPRTVHFQEWWVRMGASVPAMRITAAGVENSLPADGVLEAIRSADVIVLPPSNPVVSIGVILQVPGIRDALRAASAPVVGVSPIVGGAPVRGHADACLRALGLPVTPMAVARLYADFLDGWLVAEGDADDAGAVDGRPDGLVVRSRPLLMRDAASTRRLAAETIVLAGLIEEDR